MQRERASGQVGNEGCEQPCPLCQFFLAPEPVLPSPRSSLQASGKNQWIENPADGQVSPRWLGNTHAQPPSTATAIESAGQGFKSCLTSKPTSFHYSTQSLSKAVTLSVIYFKAPQYWWWDGHYVSKLNLIYLWGLDGYLHSLNRSLYSRGSSY